MSALGDVRLPGHAVRLGSALSLRVDPRAAVVHAALAGAVVVAAVAALAYGGSALAPAEVVAALAGSADPPVPFIVEQLRLPRVLTAVMVGASFGVAGAILQAITRNPLGSPDVLGFTAGASAFAVLEIVVLGGGAAAVAAGSVAGGMATAALVYALAYRRGTDGYRIVLIGIALSSALYAVTQFLIARGGREVAASGQVWLTGSLSGRGWEHVEPVALALVVLLPVVAALARGLGPLALGDDMARGLGLRAERSRLALVMAGTALAAVATASAGPVAFVALASPQLARRLTGVSGAGLTGAALMGALVLVVSDLAAQRVFGDLDVPVGVVTGVVGGGYLIWLLWREWRSGWRG